MKIYNIDDSRELLNRLASCKGCVKLISENGDELELSPGSPAINSLPFYYIEGTIRRMEVLFQNAEDCDKILFYLVNKRGAAA